MYDELVKRLRDAAKMSEALAVLLPHGEGNATAKLYNDAADAIAELSRENDSLAKSVNEASEILRKRWIPVTERLPEDGKFVLVCNDDGHMMIAKHETETYEWYYKYTNYDFDIWENEEQGPVCYWMPLPQLPKEEA